MVEYCFLAGAKWLKLHERKGFPCRSTVPAMRRLYVPKMRVKMQGTPVKTTAGWRLLLTDWGLQPFIPH
jgi:hypothetical protein